MNKTIFKALFFALILAPQEASTADRGDQRNFTNLVICNDVTEKFRNDEFDELTIPVIMFDLLEALSDQLVVICTKTLWVSIQNRAQFIDDHRLSTITDPQKKKIHDEIIKIEKFLKQMKAPGFKKFTHEETMEQISISSSTEKAYVFNMLYHALCKNNIYDCKEITPDFLLFIPKKLRDNSKSTQDQDLALGLAFSHLRDFQYRQMMPKSEQLELFVRNFDHYVFNELGAKLLEALAQLQFPSDLKSQSHQMFNVIIAGHGSLQTVTAEISIIKNDGKQYSDLQSVLNWFDTQVHTSSIAFISCYPGGKKLKDAFGLNNKYVNPYLEQISYPIINVGSLLTVTYAPFQVANNLLKPHAQRPDGWGPQTTQMFPLYFEQLCRKIPDYQKAAIIISGIYDQMNQKFNSFRMQNYVSIKFPHTSWFRPTQFDEFVYKISPIHGLTKKQIIISDSIEAILLEANEVTAPIILTGDRKRYSLPVLLPMNHDNNSYVIYSMDIGDSLYVYTLLVPKPLFEQLENLGLRNIEEPVQILIKELKAVDASGKRIIYKNVCLLNHVVVDGELSTGLSFINEKNEGFMRIFKIKDVERYVFHEHGAFSAAPSNRTDIKKLERLAYDIEKNAMQAPDQGLSWAVRIKNAEQLLLQQQQQKAEKIQRTERALDLMHIVVQNVAQEQKKQKEIDAQQRQNVVARALDLMQAVAVS